MPKIPEWLAWLLHSLAVALASATAAGLVPMSGPWHTAVMLSVIALSSLGFAGAYQVTPKSASDDK